MPQRLIVKDPILNKKVFKIFFWHVLYFIWFYFKIHGLCIYCKI